MDVTPPAHPTIHVRATPAGGLDVVFPPARKMVPFAMLLWAGWLAAFVLLDSSSLPAFFAPVSLLVGMAFAVVPVVLWFGTSRLLIDRGHVTVRRSVLGIGQTSRLPVSDIENAVLERREFRGSRVYRVDLVRRDGRRLSVGAALGDGREAEWVVAELRKALAAAV